MHNLSAEEENGKKCFYTTHRIAFKAVGTFQKDTVNKVFNFAFGMTFGHKGEHRGYRSGGRYRRKPGEVFRDAFQGKLAEFSVHTSLKCKDINYPEPSLEMWERGRWDISDAEISSKKICIKSAKHYSDLLLLETKDWDQNGEYIPNIESSSSHYDYFILVRIKPSLEELLKKAMVLYSHTASESDLKSLLTEKAWESDIPGFINHEQLLKAIRGKYILPRGGYLNGKVAMDAENYYVQAGDMNDFSDIVPLLK